MPNRATNNGRDLLLVEDNPGDVHLIMRALAQCNPAHRVTAIGDGRDALAYLRRHGQHAYATRPDLILLDLNLPRRDGREVLAELKADPELKTIPVVVFSSSEASRDVTDSYALAANCYVTKPVDLHEFVAAVQSIEQFWLRSAQLPVPPAAAGSRA